jgi:predicted nucleic acid binding AN1-type Zn finger protein
MFKDTKEGQTHHDKDACYKCKMCGDHFFTEEKALRCNHDCWIAKELQK